MVTKPPEHMARTPIHVEISIQAPAQKVWDILTDFDRYSEWNRFMPTAKLPRTVGDSGYVEVRMNLNSDQLTKATEKILHWEAPHQVQWGSQHTWYIKTVRTQTLESLPDGSTRYTSHEYFRGPLAWLTLLLYGKSILRGFQAMAEDLKACAEG